MHLPAGLAGWSVFVTGLLLVAYRLHGIDSPRAWIEWTERRFAYATKLRIVGGVLLLAAGVVGYFGKPVPSIIGYFAGSVLLVGIIGFSLIILQNHVRHLLLATAEASDMKIRIGSIITTLLGLGLALAPFYF